MATLTSTEVAVLIAKQLQIHAEGDGGLPGPQADDCLRAYRGAYDELETDGLVFWDFEECPESAADHVAAFGAQRLAGIYGKSMQFDVQLEQRARRAYHRLRLLAYPDDLHSTAPVTDYC